MAVYVKFCLISNGPTKLKNFLLLNLVLGGEFYLAVKKKKRKLLLHFLDIVELKSQKE